MISHRAFALMLLAALVASPLQAADVVPTAMAAPDACQAESPGAGMAGDVVLQFQTVAGRATDIRIVRSSGISALDKAAVLALARCRLPNQEAVVGTVEYRFGADAADARPVLAEARAVRAMAADLHR